MRLDSYVESRGKKEFIQDFGGEHKRRETERELERLVKKTRVSRKLKTGKLSVDVNILLFCIEVGFHISLFRCS